MIAADTIGVFQGEVIGKPTDTEHARSILTALSGNEHTVRTGLVVWDVKQKEPITHIEETLVKFHVLTPEQIQWYLDTGESRDKAGAYGIQGKGCFLVESITGDYFNVVGLPVSRLLRILEGLIPDLLSKS